MISYYFLKIILGIAGLVLLPLKLLPDVSTDLALTSALTSTGNYLALLDVIFPVGTLFTVFGLWAIIRGAWFAYDKIRWAYRKIPGLN